MKYFLILVLLLFFSVSAWAKQERVSIGSLKKQVVKLGQNTEVSLVFQVAQGLHIQANPASRKNLIATTLTVRTHDGIQLGNPTYPENKPFRLKGADYDIATYDGKVTIKLPVKVYNRLEKSTIELKAKLRYQACDESSCFFPETLALNIPLLISEK